MSGKATQGDNRLSVTFQSALRKRGATGRFVPVAGSALVVLAVLGTGFGSDESTRKEFRANRFTVIDKNGKERAEFGILENGETGMVTWNEQKNNAVAVTVTGSGMPHIMFQNSKPEVLLELAMLDDEFPAVIMRDGQGRRRLGIAIGEKGQISLGLYDREKQNRCSLSVNPDGDPQLLLRDRQGNARSRFVLDTTGTSALDMLDANGEPRIVLQVDSKGTSDAAVLGEGGKPIWSANKSGAPVSEPPPQPGP